MLRPSRKLGNRRYRARVRKKGFGTMKKISYASCLILAAFGCLHSSARAEHWTDSMTEGKPAFKSMGPLAFGPEGILFVADRKAAAIVAIATGDTKPAPPPSGLK